MKYGMILTAAAAFSALGVIAHAAEDPFADVVETRHGLMLQMAVDLGKMGGMMKGETQYDAAIAGRAAANIAAIASVLSMDQFPVGSENGASADSFAKVELWSNEQDFLAKIADLNAAAVAIQPMAVADLDTMKAGMAGLGKACGACHSAYRLTEN